jgi:hypothetical protein
VSGLYYGAIDLLEAGTVRNNDIISTINSTGTGAGVYIALQPGNVYNYAQINASLSASTSPPAGSSPTAAPARSPRR